MAAGTCPPALTLQLCAARLEPELTGGSRGFACRPSPRIGRDVAGTKKGCDHGQCGACTVLVNGRRIVSCLTLAVMQDGAEITTVEGLATNGKLHPLQQAFISHAVF